MKFVIRPRQPHRIDLTSLIDVVFMLLLFFVLTTTFEKHTGVEIKYPSSSIDTLEFNQDTIYLQIDSAGRYRVNGLLSKSRNEDEIAKDLKQYIVPSKEQQLLIHADARTSHQSVVTALAAAQLASIDNVGVVTVARELTSR